MLTIPQILLILMVVGLFVLLVTTCIKFSKGPLSTAALKNQLLQLQSKFINAAQINPELERQEMESLQNKIKTSSNPLLISDDNDLKLLFDRNRNYIQTAMKNTNLANRSSWIKLRELMSEFDEAYFQK